MVKFYLRSFFVALLSGALPTIMPLAQTTITTATGTTGYTGTNGVTGNSVVTFVIENTNAFPVILNGMEDYKAASYPAGPTTFTLWYSASSLSGAVTVGTTDWTQITTSPTLTLVTGYNTIFTTLGFTIPANTQYRFALQSTNGLAYSGSGAGSADPDIITAAGVSLKLGEALVNGAVVGYAGAFPTPPNSPRWFTGSITFEPAGPCTSPPVAGTVTTLSNTVCSSNAFTLGLTGGTGGTGQTYQWQSSANNVNFTNVAGAVNATLITSQIASTYYRATVTCGGFSVSTPAVLISSPALVSGMYTINSGVATGGTNFQTFTDAFNYIKCGINGPVVFNVNAASGPYNEQVTVPHINGASAVNPVIINGNGRTINFNSVNTNERACIKLDGADYITIKNLVINGTGTTTTDYNYGIQLLNDADFNKIDSCTITIPVNTSLNYSGIVISGSASSATTTGSDCDYNIISNNVVTGGYYGITVVGLSTAYINGNQVKNNTIADFYFYGIYVNGTSGCLIEGNNISRPNRPSTLISSFYGIYFSGNSDRALVSKNRLHDPFAAATSVTSSAYGISFASTDAAAGSENIVSNNLIYNFIGGGSLYALYNSGSDSVLYYHNTVSLEDAGYTGTSTYVAYGFYQITTARGIQIKNNIIKVQRGGAGAKYCLYLAATGVASGIISNYNDLINLSNTGTGGTAYISLPTPATSYSTLTDWTNGSGQDLKSVAVDPVFAGAATGNFKPTATELDNKGTPAGITTDITGATRSTISPDIGAYEFSGPVPVRLISLAASKAGSDILVNWTTANETNFSYYQIERSADGTNFTQAGVQLSGTQATGNIAMYHFNDKNIVVTATAKTRYYRLKMVDKDGRYDYSKLVTVHLNKDAVLYVKAYPSPFSNELYIQVETPQAATMQATLTDATGKVLMKIQQPVAQGNNTIVMNGLNKIQPGTYQLTVTLNGKRSSITVVK